MKSTLILSIVILALGVGSPLVANPQPAAPAAAPTTVSKADRRFLEKAAQMGKADLEFAKLGAARATDSNVKTYAQKLTADHEKANADLTALAARKGVQFPTEDRETHAYDSLTKKKVGTEFDSAFAKEMASDHDDAVSLYDKAAKKSDDPEIASFASNQLPILEENKRTAETLAKTIK